MELFSAFVTLPLRGGGFGRARFCGELLHGRLCLVEPPAGEHEALRSEGAEGTRRRGKVQAVVVVGVADFRKVLK